MVLLSSPTDKPIITLPFPVVKGIRDHLLWCSADGTPPIQVKMSHNNTLLASGIGTVIYPIDQAGKYTCSASNTFGTDSRDFQVTLMGKLFNITHY